LDDDDDDDTERGRRFSVLPSPPHARLCGWRDVDDGANDVTDEEAAATTKIA
jgi:hypothetical protein